MRPKIMYIENKTSGLNGRGRICCVSFSETGKSLYYDGRALVDYRFHGILVRFVGTHEQYDHIDAAQV